MLPRELQLQTYHGVFGFDILVFTVNTSRLLANHRL